MLQEILVVLILVTRVMMLYVLPIFKTFKLQSLPIETQSVANREMLLYWILLILLLLVEKGLFFLNDYFLYAIETAFVLWLWYPRIHGIGLVLEKISGVQSKYVEYPSGPVGYRVKAT